MWDRTLRKCDWEKQTMQGDREDSGYLVTVLCRTCRQSLEEVLDAFTWMRWREQMSGWHGTRTTNKDGIGGPEVELDQEQENVGEDMDRAPHAGHYELWVLSTLDLAIRTCRAETRVSLRESCPNRSEWGQATVRKQPYLRSDQGKRLTFVTSSL